MVQHWYLLFLLACGIGAASSNNLECSAEDACFGYPTLCDPNNDCQILFKFDEQGNIDLQLKDFTNPNGFVAFVVGKWPDSTSEYLMCIPNAQRRLRVVARPREQIQMNEEHMARYVRKLSDKDFRCTFMASEVPAELIHQDSLFVTTGNFSDKMILPDGQPVFKVESDDVYIHRIAAASKEDEGVLSADEKKMTDDFVAKLRRISAREEEDKGLEDLLEKQERAIRKEDNEDEDDLGDLLDSNKKYSTRRRQQQKEESRRNAKKNDKEDEDEEEEEEEEEEKPKKKSKNSRGSRRRNDDEEDEEDEEEEKSVKKRKKPSRRHPADEDDDDNEEEEEEEEEKEKKKSKKRNNKKGKGRKQTPKSSDEVEYDDFAKEDNEDEDSEDEDSNSSNHVASLTALTAAIYVMIH